MVRKIASKLLTKEETKKLLIAYREYGESDAINLLIEYNQGLVGFFALRYLGKGLTFEELMSAGNEGLFRAIRIFNYKESAIEGFGSYISVAIENQMKNELKKYNKHSHVVSFDQPIGQNKNGDEMTIEDLVGTEADDLINNVISDMKIGIVKDALQCLTTRERQIILLRYGLDEKYRKTQAEVAGLLGCSKTTVIRQENKALIKMRHPRNTRKLKDFIEE